MIDPRKTIACVWTNQHHEELRKEANQFEKKNGGLVSKLINDLNCKVSTSKHENYQRGMIFQKKL